MPNMHDMYGRTETEIEEALELQRMRLRIDAPYSGSEGLADKRDIMRANIAVDERCLAEIRGAPISFPRGDTACLMSDGRGGYKLRPTLSGQALDQWRETVLSLHRARR
jgi:hypothetical protein